MDNIKKIRIGFGVYCWFRIFMWLLKKGPLGWLVIACVVGPCFYAACPPASQMEPFTVQEFHEYFPEKTEQYIKETGRQINSLSDSEKRDLYNKFSDESEAARKKKWQESHN
jgi:hypothetical protein